MNGVRRKVYFKTNTCVFSLETTGQIIRRSNCLDNVLIDLIQVQYSLQFRQLEDLFGGCNMQLIDIALAL